MTSDSIGPMQLEHLSLVDQPVATNSEEDSTTTTSTTTTSTSTPTTTANSVIDMASDSSESTLLEPLSLVDQPVADLAKQDSTKVEQDATVMTGSNVTALPVVCDDDNYDGDIDDEKIVARYRPYFRPHFERAFAEVEELYALGKYDKALEVFEKGHDSNSGASYLLDKEIEQKAKIKARINLNVIISATTNPELQKSLFDESAKGLIKAIYRRSRGDVELQNLLWYVLDTRFYQLIPRGSSAYDAVPTPALVEAGNVWLTWFGLWSEYYMTWSGSFPNDQHRPHEFLQRIGSELANRNELIQSRSLMNRAAASVPVAHGGATWMYLYLGIEAECAEALNDLDSANAIYTAIQQYQHRSKDTFCYDTVGSPGNTKCALPGTLSERIDRTSGRYEV
jgi:tetratricopeptide (TPR) repeat protein